MKTTRKSKILLIMLVGLLIRTTALLVQYLKEVTGESYEEDMILPTEDNLIAYNYNRI